MRGNMELINQQLEVKKWPLTKAGEERFFGYVVSMGIFPREWGMDDGMIQYVDFAYNNSYERYRLPDDKGLKKLLNDMLWRNINETADGVGICGKVWIKRTEIGYEVFAS